MSATLTASNSSGNPSENEEKHSQMLVVYEFLFVFSKVFSGFADIHE